MIANGFIVWIFCILQLVSPVLGGNLAGALEKVYLWRGYNIAWAMYGPDQKVFLPKTRAPGSGPDGKLNFQECMKALTGLRTCTVPEPTPGGDIIDTAKALRDQGFGGNVLVQKAAPSLSGSGGHRSLIQRIITMTDDAHVLPNKSPQLQAALDAGLDDMMRAPDYIRRIRTSENDPYVIKDIKYKFPDITAVPELKTDPELDLRWQRLDMEKTLEQNPGLRGEKKATFKDWVSNYGDGKWNTKNPGLPPQTPAATSHFETLEIWRFAGDSGRACFIDNL